MQVSHHNDHITHAVIGGKQSIEFGISTSAEFFNILSSTLYKDQILAVVREVLCNAWDAHIEAGCTDLPVQVTLTENEFSVKDFGKGIHHDDMGVIYGTYGNSTKKNDGQQTGGFGLGCKAPFAYTDHFEVTSAHAGIRTIYNLSKSSAQAMGKPGITPIASFPCEEHGLTVKLRIKPSDHSRFKQLIRRIAHNGDMNMKLNGEQLPTLEFDTSKENFLLTRTHLLDTLHPIMVRYGNVIYPVDSQGVRAQYDEIGQHLARLKGAGYSFSIVFQAPPHSIAVTPSRESLSMQDHTIKTLTTLFDGFLKAVEANFMPECHRYTEALINQAVTEKRIDQLLKREQSLPVLGNSEMIYTIRDFEEMAKAYLQYYYPRGIEYRKKDITRRLEAMVQANLLDRGRVSTFLRDLKNVREDCSGNHAWRQRTEPNTWLQRRVLAPLMVKLKEAGLSTDQLFTCSHEDNNWQNNHREEVPPLVPAKSSSPHHLLTVLPYLRNIVVITTRRLDLTARAYRHPVFKEAGQYHGYLVYVAGRKKGELEAVRQFFAKEGMRVADLTQEEADDIPVRAKPSTPRKPTKKGIVKLSSILRDNGIYTPLCQQEDAARMEDPEFVYQVSFRSGNDFCGLDNWGSTLSHHLVKLFGDKGGITNNSATYHKWREKGAKDFDTYVQEKICAYMLNNPRIAAYWAYRSKQIMDKTRHTELMETICDNPHLAKAFNLVNPLTYEDQVYLALWQKLTRHSHVFYNNLELSKVRDWLDSIPVASEAAQLIKQMESPLVSLLSISELHHMLSYTKNPDIPAIVSLLKTILK